MMTVAMIAFGVLTLVFVVVTIANSDAHHDLMDREDEQDARIRRLEEELFS